MVKNIFNYKKGNFMKHMLVGLALGIGTSFAASAAYTGNQSVKKIFGSGSINFGVSAAPEDTCNYYGRHFTFDATTEAGKNMLSILLAAHLSKKEVDVWYTPSSVPSKTNEDGCTSSNMAVMFHVGFSQ
jgi:hypothetical protein